MVTLNIKELKNMNAEDKEKKMKELRIELIKSRSGNSKTGNKAKEIKKIIARILTLNKSEENKSSKKVEKNK